MSDRTMAGFGAAPIAAAAPAKRRLWLSFAHALRVYLTRRSLRDLEPRLLEDVGISYTDALAEASRAPWDLVPLNLHRNHRIRR